MTTRTYDSVTLFMCVWLFSSVAFSNGSQAPELPLLTQAKSAAEYPILRRIQDLTLELQLLEITIKNRRDQGIEDKITSSLKEVEEKGQVLTQRFRAVRTEQLDGLYSLMVLGKRYGKAIGVSEIEWDELFDALKEGHLQAGPVVVHTKKGSLNLLTLAPLVVGKEIVWSVSLPAYDRKSFWVQARARASAGLRGIISPLSNQSLERRTALVNAPYADAAEAARVYYTESYAKLYGAFEDHRYAVLQRISMARKALQELAKTNGAMSAPEQYSALYNQVLDNLYSYGVDISLTGAAQRDIAIKGFLFADTPERSQELLEKLKFHPNASDPSYNSPSS